MTFRNILAMLLVAATTFGVSAESVVLSSAGTLKNLISNPSTVTSLEVSGPINAADFEYINEKLPQLTRLDLSQATIVAYRGEPVLLNRTDFPAHELPAFSLAGLKLTQVTFPASLTAIGDGALSSSSLSSVALPSGLRSIGEGAFSNCNGLTQLSVPASVTSIGNHAFSYCDNLATVDFQATDIPERAFFGCQHLSSFTAPALRTIGAYAFYGCSSLAQFNFPSTLTAIQASAFEQSGLVNIDLSQASSLATIGDWAFARCASLKTALLSPSTTTLGQGLFFDDTALATVEVPVSVTVLPDYIFTGDNAVDTLGLIHDNITSIGNFALKGLDQVSSFTLPSKLEWIGEEGMADWTSLQVLRATGITDPIPELGDNVWAGIDCSKVELVVYRTMLSSFQQADQWCEFNITTSTGIEDVVVDKDPAQSLKAWFEGSDLHIVASDEIEMVKIFDINGRQLVSVNPYAQEAVIDAGDLGRGVLIVQVAVEGSVPVTLKLTR